MVKIADQAMKNDLIRMFEEAGQYEENGNLDKAEEVTLAILEKYPGQFHALRWLGQHALNNNDPGMAITYFNEAHHVDPSNYEVVVALAHVMADSALNSDARIAYERALKMNPKDKEVALSLGEIYRRLGEPKKAEKVYKSLMVETPGDGQALVGLAHVARGRGNAKKALDFAMRALKTRPHNSGAWAIFAESRKFNELPKEFSQMEEVFEKIHPETESSISLGFSMGKILDDVGDYERAFKVFREANDKVDIQYDTGSSDESAGTLFNVFTPQFFEKCKDYGSSSERPVFIVGMPRSGTSLTEQILASHPDVFGAGELQIMGDMRVHIIPEFQDVPLPYPQCLTELGPEAFAKMADFYLEKSSEAAGNEIRITDKFPHNFANLGLVSTLFPKARIIHCKRDPMDTCFSIYVRNFTRNYPFASKFEFLGHQYKQYLRIMDHWKSVLPVEILEVNYEDVIADQEGQSRRMVDFVGLPWDDACLEFNKTKRSVVTFSHWQVRQPIYSSSVAKWKQYEPWLGPLKDALGYEG